MATERVYTPYEERFQQEERGRRMRWTRASWMASVEDTLFEHELLGVEAIPFSGDTRPAHPGGEG